MLKSILTNTVAQLVAKAIAVILTFVTTVMIIRIGGPDLFGDLTKSLTLIAIGFTAIDFGLNAVAVRSMVGPQSAQVRTEKQIIVARIVLSIGAIGAINSIVFLLPGGYTPAIKSVFWIGSLSILFQGIFTSGNAWFQRRLEYWKSSLIAVVGSLIGATLTYVAILYRPTLAVLLLASTLGYAAMAILTLLLLPRLKYASSDWVISSVWLTIRRSVGLGLILILSMVASKTDSVILGIFRSSGEVGQYGFAYRIFDVLLVIPTFAMNSIYPLLVDRSTQDNRRIVARSSAVLVVLGVVCAVAAYFAAPLINVIRPGMDQAISAVRILIISLPLFYLTSPRMWQLIHARQEKYLVCVYAVAAVSNGVANYLLAPTFGYTASAWITGATELMILLGLYLPHPALTKSRLS